MSDVSGIPNMGFGGGSYFGGSGLANAYAQQAQNANYFAQQQAIARQAQAYNPWANTPGGFGAQTAYYQQAAANNYGAINASAQADRIRAIYGAGALSGYNAPRQYGWMPNEGAPAYNPYNAARQYGWMHNEGAPAPAAPQVYNRGQFNPQTYGWDHNEGAMGFQPPPQLNFNDRYIHPAPRQVPSPYGPGGYPPMEPATPGQQSSNTNWYGMPNASS